MRSKLFGNVAAFMSLGMFLIGCSESLVPEPSQPLEKDTDFYINVKIATPAEEETRADNTNTSANDYVNGTDEEQAINKILFVFYNSANQYVGNATYTPSGNQTAVDDKIAGSIETIMQFTVPVTVAAGSTKPAYVMAYVNPTLKAESDLFNDYEKALGAFRNLDDVLPSSKTNGHKGFTMNNSVHYEAEKNDELPTIAIPIKSTNDNNNQLFTSEADALASANPIVIYVERVVAKVTLNEGDNITESNNTVTAEDGVTTYTLNFEALGWGLSNLEKATFLVKNFRTDDVGNPTVFTSPMTFTNYQYGTLNGRLNSPSDPTKSLENPSWNFPGGNNNNDANWGISGHRTFWALSPTYYHKDDDGDNMVNIPSYADEIYNGTTVNDAKFPLKYRSYNDIYNVSGTKPVVGTYGKNIGDTQYTLEHTMQASMVTDFQKRAVTCAVVVGKYILKDGNTDVKYDNFYIRKIMTEDGAKTIIYPSDNDMKKAYLEKNNTIYIKDPADNSKWITVPYEIGEGGNEYFADFEIEHPFLDSPVPSRYVTLKLKDNVPANKYYYQNATGSAFVPVTSANVKAVNSDLYNNLVSLLGGIEMYYSGYAYFEVPVRHLWGRSNKNMGENEFAAQLGQYGIVRNHSYNIQVTGIEGIGVGISDPDAPIIPNVENDNYVVKTEIRVQRWRVVPTQSVTLKP